jgi:hypothetical protein
MYTVLPLPVVQRWAKANLSSEQLLLAIKEARGLETYPVNPKLDVSPCGLGFEFRFHNAVLGRQGWLRAIFWVHEPTLRIFIVDLFWKKTNRVSKADMARAEVRIAKLKALLAAGGDPWKD